MYSRFLHDDHNSPSLKFPSFSPFAPHELRAESLLCLRYLTLVPIAITPSFKRIRCTPPSMISSPFQTEVTGSENNALLEVG